MPGRTWKTVSGSTTEAAAGIQGIHTAFESQLTQPGMQLQGIVAEFGQITATGITIRDASGMELVAIGSDKEKGSGISIFNHAGKPVITLGVPVDGIGSGMMVSDAEGRPRIGLGMDEGIPGIALVDEKGAKILAMGGGGEGYGILINDKEEVQRIGLGYKDGDAGIMLYDEKGQYVRGMFRQKDGLNYFSYIDADGKEIFE